MRGVGALLVFLPLTLGAICNPKTLGGLDAHIVYQKGLLDKLVGEGKHTILYSDGYQTVAAHDLTRTTYVRGCIVTQWFRTPLDDGYYRTISVYDDDAKFVDKIRIDVKINEHSHHLYEVWPNGDTFDVYPVHLEDGVLGLYSCQVHQHRDIDGTPKIRNNLRTYFGLSMRTSETRFKSDFRSTWLTKGLSSMERVGLMFTDDDKLSWCYSEVDNRHLSINTGGGSDDTY